MNLKKSPFIALAIVLAAQIASPAEEAWSNSSVSDLSIFVTLQRFRIHADHCSTKIPVLKPMFDSVMQDLGSHILGVSRELLSSSEFKGMKDEPVPAEISFALKDSLDDAKYNFERKEAESVCAKTLQNLIEVNDESLKADLTQTLKAVQNMTQNLEKKSAR